MDQEKFQNYFGYKNHVKVDSETKLITAFKVTPANVADKYAVDDLLDKKEDADQPLYGDAAYSSSELEELYRKKDIISKVNRKGYRNKSITQKQQNDNSKQSKVRARVEHVFGFMANSMNGKFLKYRSFIRNQIAIGLMNITYNLFRLVQLNIELRK